MKIKYHLAKDTINSNDIDALVGWLNTYPRLTQGEGVKNFEEKWSEWIGREYSCMCNSGSSANLLMYHALLYSGLCKNKKIIVPSCGWATTIAPAIQLGFEPIMCEADKDTWGLDLVHLEKLLIEHNPDAVILVHILGVPHKMDEIVELKKRYGFTLLEDACASVGAEYKGKKVGTFGDMASVSLYFGHQISTIEGGIVVTDDKELYSHIVMGRSHGWGKDMPNDKKKDMETRYNVDPFHNPFIFYEPGYNLRATDLQAFIGVRQIERMGMIVEKRSQYHARYNMLLGDSFGVQKSPEGATVCSIHFCVLAENSKERRHIVENLDQNGIETRLFTAGNLGRHPFWTEKYGDVKLNMADELYERGFFLPNHPSLTEDDIDYISSVVIKSKK